MKHLIVGPDRHGVTAYALQLARLLNLSENDIIREVQFGSSDLPDEPIHITFTDHLFGATSSTAVTSLLHRVGSRPLSVSFHDIPQPEEGEERFAKRTRAYRRLADAATLVTVNSHHEAIFFPADVHPAVIYLPIPQVDITFDPEPMTVGILGYLYPGKGYEDIVAAVDGTDYALRFLGEVSHGHEEWAQELARHGEITGWLKSDDLAREMGRIAVPVCPHRHFSASGSLMAWLGSGRTLLARDSEYTREIDHLVPGRITLVQPGGWLDAIKRFEPQRLEAPDYGWPEVANAWLREWTACGLM